MSPDYVTPTIRVTVQAILEGGEAPCGYKPGDSWDIEDLHAPAGLCTWAITAMSPFLAALRFGGSMPWETDPDRSVVSCPDAANPVVFELRRLPIE